MSRVNTNGQVDSKCLLPEDRAAAQAAFVEAAKAVELGRQSQHGDHTAGHRRLGRAWAAILSDFMQEDLPDLPPHVVELLLVALKVQRAARPFRRSEDDYVDGLNYLQFAARDSKDYRYGQPCVAGDLTSSDPAAQRA